MRRKIFLLIGIGIIIVAMLACSMPLGEAHQKTRVALTETAAVTASPTYTESPGATSNLCTHRNLCAHNNRHGNQGSNSVQPGKIHHGCEL